MLVNMRFTLPPEPIAPHIVPNELSPIRLVRVLDDDGGLEFIGHYGEIIDLSPAEICQFWLGHRFAPSAIDPRFGVCPRCHDAIGPAPIEEAVT